MNGMLDLADYELVCPPELFAAEARLLHEVCARRKRRFGREAAEDFGCLWGAVRGVGNVGRIREPGGPGRHSRSAYQAGPEHTNRAESHRRTSHSARE